MIEELNCANREECEMLYAARELTEEECAAVDAHAVHCASCAAVLSREMNLRGILAARVQPADALDGSKLLLARCRSELFEAMDDASAQARRAWRSFLMPWRWMAFRHAFVFHPGWSAAALLLAGALAGTAANEWYRQIASLLPGKPVIAVSAPAPLTQEELETIDRDGIRLEPQSDSPAPKVELQVRSPRPRVVQGRPAAAEIRRVLAYVIGHAGQFAYNLRPPSLDPLRPLHHYPPVQPPMRRTLPPE